MIYLWSDKESLPLLEFWFEGISKELDKVYYVIVYLQ